MTLDRAYSVHNAVAQAQRLAAHDNEKEPHAGWEESTKEAIGACQRGQTTPAESGRREVGGS